MSVQIKETKNGNLNVFEDASKFACIAVESAEPLTNAAKTKVVNIMAKILQALQDDISAEPLVLSFDAQNEDSRFVVKTTIKKIQ